VCSQRIFQLVLLCNGSLTLAVAGVGGVVEEVGVAVEAPAPVRERRRLLAGAAVAAVLHQARWQRSQAKMQRFSLLTP
jgi:hypothetical protein